MKKDINISKLEEIKALITDVKLRLSSEEDEDNINEIDNIIDFICKIAHEETMYVNISYKTLDDIFILIKKGLFLDARKNINRLMESISRQIKQTDNYQDDNLEKSFNRWNEKVKSLLDSEKEIQEKTVILDAYRKQAEQMFELSKQAIENANAATIEVLGLANTASQSGLAKEFERCIQDLQRGRRLWLIAVIASLVSMGWVLTWEFLNVPSPQSNINLLTTWFEGLLHRLPLIFPCLFAVWLSSRRYHDTVRLIEDYRFKSRLCATYSGFLDACRRIDGCTEMAATGEGGQPVVQTRRSYDAEMELTRTVLRVISTDPTRHLRKDKQDSGPILGAGGTLRGRYRWGRQAGQERQLSRQHEANISVRFTANAPADFFCRGVGVWLMYSVILS